MLGVGEIKKQVNESKLLFASKNGEFTRVKNMIEKEGININVQSFFTGRTPIIHSARNSHENIVEYLLHKGADLQKPDYFDEILVVHAIKSKLSNHMCNSLLEKYSYLNYKDETGKSLLHLSILHKRKNVFSYLIEKKVLIETYDKDGVSPLMVACEKGEYEIVKSLLDNGAKINRIDKCQTPRTVTDYASKYIDILNLLSKYRNN